MSEIVKICKVHGELTKEQTVINNSRKLSRNKTKFYYTQTLRCKQCNRERCKKWQQIHWRKRYEKEKNTEKYKRMSKNITLKRQFGITLEDYERMLKEQNDCCAICFKTEKVKDGKYKTLRSLSVDHCHDTKKVRGLLCNNCNRMLGYSQDSIAIHESAINYLKR